MSTFIYKRVVQHFQPESRKKKTNKPIITLDTGEREREKFSYTQKEWNKFRLPFSLYTSRIFSFIHLFFSRSGILWRSVWTDGGAKVLGSQAIFFSESSRHSFWYLIVSLYLFSKTFTRPVLNVRYSASWSLWEWICIVCIIVTVLYSKFINVSLVSDVTMTPNQAAYWSTLISKSEIGSDRTKIREYKTNLCTSCSVYFSCIHLQDPR
jgi:hypothetical protein